MDECKWCDGPVEQHGRGRKLLYCSPECKKKFENNKRDEERRARRISKRCLNCSELLLEAKSGVAKYCNTKCSNDHRNSLSSQRRWTQIEASRKPCRGCLTEIPRGRSSKAEFCSDECKISSRRHETYGLTKVELDRLLAQGDCCQICKTTEWTNRGPQVDHDHQTGAVRGILCINCNNGLGRFKDSVELLEKATLYLKGF